MNYITEETTVSVRLFPTATTGRSETVVLDMSQYRNAIAKVNIINFKQTKRPIGL
jgi:hypothetical protein